MFKVDFKTGNSSKEKKEYFVHKDTEIQHSATLWDTYEAQTHIIRHTGTLGRFKRHTGTVGHFKTHWDTGDTSKDTLRHTHLNTGTNTFKKNTLLF